MNGKTGFSIELSDAAPMCCLGFGAALVANHNVLRESSSLIDALGLAAYGSDVLSSCLELAFLVTLAILGLISLSRGSELGARRLAILQTTAFAVSTIAGALAPFAAGVALNLVLLIALGVFCAASLIVWTGNLCRLSMPEIQTVIVTTLFAMPLAYLFSVYAAQVTGPQAVTAVLCASSTVASWLYLHRTANSDSPGLGTVKAPRGYDAATMRLVTLHNLPAILCMSAFGFSLSISSAVALSQLGSQVVVLVFSCGMLIAPTVFTSVFYRKKTLKDLSGAYLALAPVCVSFFLFMPSLPPALLVLFLLMSSALGTLGMNSVFLSIFGAHKSFGIPATGSYALCAAIAEVFYLVGWFGGILGGTWYVVSALIFIYVVSLALFLRHRRRDEVELPQIESTESRAPAQNALSFTEACDAIARRFDLSQREVDVMRLFARDASVEQAAEELVISANTVRTHSKNLYRKLGIHTKTELVRLIAREQGAEVSGPER